MNRLPFLLPDFTRIIWHSEAARQVWESRISRINKMWGAVERQAVVDGIRDSCLTFVDPQHLPEVSMWAAKRGLVVLPVAVNGVASQYSATSAPVVGGAFQYRIVLTRRDLNDLPGKWARIWTAGELDNNAVGEMLGYPECCRKFFQRVWIDEQKIDTTWDMANAGHATVWEVACDDNKACAIVVPEHTPPESNILLRWLGVRLVPHLPCAFDCSWTRAHGRTFEEIAQSIDGEARNWLYEMLSWPVEWSALHGIAEIRTPLLTISTRTDATSDRLVVKKEGERYPDEGASGLKFPFRIVKGKVTDKPSFKRSVRPIYELNGFGSQRSMDLAHDAVLNVLPPQVGFLLDLGCGTGRLLERAEDNGWTVAGVELDNERAGAGSVRIRRGSLFDLSLWESEFDVIAFMPGRLLEVEGSQAALVREALKQRAKYVLLYAYGDWLEKFGGLGPLVASAGLGDGEVIVSSRGEGVEAALLVFNKPEESNVESIGAASAQN